MTSNKLSPRVATVLMIALMGIVFIWLAAYSSRRAMRGDVSDFQAYYVAADALCHKADPYVFAGKPYIYPPLFATLCMPLTAFPIETACVLYLPILIATVLLSLYWGAREIMERFEIPLRETLVCLAMVLTLIVMEDRIKSDLQMFQVNTLLWGLLTLSLRWLDRRPLAAGAALGLAMNIKVFPIIMLPYLLFRRRWTTAGSMIGSTVLFALFPALIIGWKTNLQYLAQSSGGFLNLLGVHTSVHQKSQIKELAVSYSVSIPSGMARILGAGHDSWAWMMVFAALAGALAFGFWVYRRSGFAWLRWPDRLRQQEQPYRALVALEWASLITLALAFSPQTNSRHFLLLATQATLASVMLIKAYHTKAWRPILTGILMLLAGLTLPPGSHRVEIMHAMEHGWQNIGGPSWLVLLSLAPLTWGGVILMKELAVSRRPAP